MQPAGIDRNILFLGVTLLIIAGAAGIHNATTQESKYTSFGLCDQEVVCNGVSVGDACLGIKRPTVSCVVPGNATDWQRAEAECALDAQGICNANPDMSGMAWTEDPSAAWQGKRCTQWADENDQVDLLSCDRTFTDITKGSDTEQAQ